LDSTGKSLSEKRFPRFAQPGGIHRFQTPQKLRGNGGIKGFAAIQLGLELTLCALRSDENESSHERRSNFYVAQVVNLRLATITQVNNLRYINSDRCLPLGCRLMNT
jgi:hypothetical protein